MSYNVIIMPLISDIPSYIVSVFIHYLFFIYYWNVVKRIWAFFGECSTLNNKLFILYYGAFICLFVCFIFFHCECFWANGKTESYSLGCHLSIHCVNNYLSDIKFHLTIRSKKRVIIKADGYWNITTCTSDYWKKYKNLAEQELSLWNIKEWFLHPS